MVFERMSEDCIGAIVTAQKQAQKFGQSEVELPFLVAGIVDMPETPAVERTLKQYGITWRKTINALQKLYPDAANGDSKLSFGSFFQARDPDDDLPFSKELQITLKGSGQIADRMGEKSIAAQHLFLAMLEYEDGNPPKAATDPEKNGAYKLIVELDGIDASKVSALEICESLLEHLKELARTSWSGGLPYRLHNFFVCILIGEVDSTVYKCQMGIGLWKIAQQPFWFKIDILTKESEVIAVLKQLIEKFFGLFNFSNFEQAVYKPESTDGKWRWW